MNHALQSSTIVQAVIHSSIAALVAISVGCSRNESSKPAPSDVEAQLFASEVPAGTCRVLKTDGSRFEHDALFVNVLLDNAYFGQASVKIYGEGTFPNSYEHAFQNGVHPEPSRQQLLSNATAWAWSVDPKKDSDGNWTLLTISKQILFAEDGLAYQIDSREVKYGERVSIKDSDSGISIDCVLPTKRF